MSHLIGCRDAAQRAPRRISLTIPDHVHSALLERSFREGRSISNLGAFLLENALVHPLAPEREIRSRFN
jgi:hypothetical protein